MTRGRSVQEFIFKWGRDGLGPRILEGEVSRGRDGLGPKCPVTIVTIARYTFYRIPLYLLHLSLKEFPKLW